MLTHANIFQSFFISVRVKLVHMLELYDFFFLQKNFLTIDGLDIKIMLNYELIVKI